MSDDAAALERFDGTVRLFPLPNLVFFPHVVQGLHIFEPRYRQLMADTLAGDRTMALVMLKDGWEDGYDGRPPIEEVACVGRVGPYEKLPDGRYNLRLFGLSRVRILGEVPTDRLYRVARGELLPDVIPTSLPRRVELRKELSDAVLSRFAEGGSEHRQLSELFDGETPLGVLCDMLAYALPLPADLKQRLLAEPVVEVRSEVMADALRARSPVGARKFPPDFSPN